MAGIIQVAWNANSGYSFTSQPTSMNQGDTLDVFPPAEGCTMNFTPSLPLSGTTSPVYSSYQFGGQAVGFTMPNVPPGQNSYNFSFSVDGRLGKSGAQGRSVPVGKLGL